ncbi:MAG: biotin/lipoyl-binding protein, partial [Alphaproteobacteria bacterium]|nr:biotin/lipoyl-binding protein [Alphaproteobacteria bacterium]
MNTYSSSVTIICAVLLAAFFLIGKQSYAEIPPNNGIGALGRIEPRSRIISVSHDAGPEGARVEKILVTEGQQVKRGDILAVFSDTPRKKAKLADAEIQTIILEARINAELMRLDFLEKDYKRK